MAHFYLMPMPITPFIIHCMFFNSCGISRKAGSGTVGGNGELPNFQTASVNHKVQFVVFCHYFIAGVCALPKKENRRKLKNPR